MTVTVIRQVEVKARVTEQLKKQLAAELQEAGRRLAAELERIELQGKRLMTEVAKQDMRQAGLLRQGLEENRQKHAEARNEILDKLKEVAGLVIGSEIVRGRVDSPVQIAVGDDWDGLFSAEILLEDGKVVEIRQ